jgi:3-oxoacyl-[acyl-carrier protein] reductase
MVFKDAIDNEPEDMGILLRKMEEDTMLKKLPSMADIANVAIFVSSDMAGKITGVTLDVTSGTTAGLNYKVAPLSSDKELHSHNDTQLNSIARKK